MAEISDARKKLRRIRFKGLVRYQNATVRIGSEVDCLWSMRYHLALICLLAFVAPSIGGISDTLDAVSHPLEWSSSSNLDPAPSRWENIGPQLLAGSVGGAVGTVGGGLVGAVGGIIVGSILYDDEEESSDERSSALDGLNITPQIAYAFFGMMIGAALGGTTGTAFMVEQASPNRYPSRGVLPAFIGTVLGASGSIAVIGCMGRTGASGPQWGEVSGALFVLGSSSLGAVLFDRAMSSPRDVVIAPWSPRPGMQGVQVGLAF